MTPTVIGQAGAAILAQAIDEHNPSHVFALFSGGDDSVCAAHIAAQHPRFTAAVLIDTGIAVAEAHEHAHATAKAQGWPLVVVPTPQDYSTLVREHGFPGPASHRYMYINLKERAVEKLVRGYKQSRTDRIVLVTGVRQQESQRRMETVTSPIVRKGAQVWVAPMWEWSREERDAYQTEHNLPHNPVKPKLHISGDCLCGAYAEKGELDLLKMFYPIEAARILAIQDEVMQKFPWTWEEGPPKWWAVYRAGQQFLGNEFMPLCWSCERQREVTP